MNMRGAVGKALFMDSERAAKYIASGKGKSSKYIAKATKAAERITDAGGSVAPDFIHNNAIRQRQMRQGMARVGAAVGGTAIIGSQSTRGNSYRPPRTAQGSGRNA
jgi:hypothetical protein